MFSIPRVNVIESDEGFSVEVLGRTGLRYVEHGRTVRIDSEVLGGPGGLAIYTSSIRSWDPPHNGEEIDENTKRRIVDNIRNALRFRGFEVDVF